MQAKGILDLTFGSNSKKPFRAEEEAEFRELVLSCYLSSYGK